MSWVLLPQLHIYVCVCGAISILGRCAIVIWQGHDMTVFSQRHDVTVWQGHDMTVFSKDTTWQCLAGTWHDSVWQGHALAGTWRDSVWQGQVSVWQVHDMTVFCRDVTPLSVTACRNMCACVCVCWGGGGIWSSLREGWISARQQNVTEVNPSFEVTKSCVSDFGWHQAFPTYSCCVDLRDYASWRVKQDLKGYICKLRVKQDQVVCQLTACLELQGDIM